MTQKLPIIETIKSRFTFIDPSKNRIGFFAFLFTVVALTGLIGFSAFNQNQEQKEKTEEKKTKESTFTPIAPYTLVYGYWKDDQSIIESFDLSSGRQYQLAQLPPNIKKVTVLSPGRMIFINETDNSDHGKEISSYDLSSKLTTPIVAASQGFGIDDYVVSQNKRYMAIWEVSFLPSSEILLGGTSRIYTLDIQNPSKKNLLFEEISSVGVPVHYPLAITNSGQVFLDQMEPNSGLQWARGMSVSNFDGSQKEDIASMNGGTFSTQPAISPDESQFAFGGHEGSAPSGAARFQTAILNPNTVETLDTNTKARFKIPGVLASSKYPYVDWDPATGNLIYKMISTDTANTGYHLYDKKTSASYELIKTGNDQSMSVISTLDKNRILLAKRDISLSAFGNLGPKYGFAITGFYVKDDQKGSTEPLPISKNLVQFIAFLPSSYFDSIANLKTVVESERKQLQLETFTIKPSLAPTRLIQQSKSPGFKWLSGPEMNMGDLDLFNLAPMADCKPAIYLYPQSTSSINVKIRSSIPLINTDPAYKASGWNVLASPSGEISSDGKRYDYIYYEAEVPDALLVKQKEGFVVKKDELSILLPRILPKLGLSEKETKEFSDYWNRALPYSRYYFVGVIPQANIDKIFPFEISPRPQSIIRVTLYFETLDEKINVQPPVITTPKRDGFAVVEWGGMFKRHPGQDFTCLE